MMPTNENRLYQCETCNTYECASFFVPTMCRCGGQVVERERGQSSITQPTSRPTLSAKRRREVFEHWHGICHITGRKIDPEMDDWDIEHVIPRWCGGKDTLENMRPALNEAHAEKTKQEASERAKGNRIINKREKMNRSKSPMKGSKASGMRRKFDGTVEYRDGQSVKQNTNGGFFERVFQRKNQRT